MGNSFLLEQIIFLYNHSHFNKKNHQSKISLIYKINLVSLCLACLYISAARMIIDYTGLFKIYFLELSGISDWTLNPLKARKPSQKLVTRLCQLPRFEWIPLYSRFLKYPDSKLAQKWPFLCICKATNPISQVPGQFSQEALQAFAP